MTLSLKKAGFFLISRYVVFSENPISVHIKGLKSLKHDAILILGAKDAVRDHQKWSRPSKINMEDSYFFCRDCGDALGWFLSSDVLEEDIHKEWKNLIAGNSNGKTSK